MGLKAMIREKRGVEVTKGLGKRTSHSHQHNKGLHVSLAEKGVSKIHLGRKLFAFSVIQHCVDHLLQLVVIGHLCCHFVPLFQEPPV